MHRFSQPWCENQLLKYFPYIILISQTMQPRLRVIKWSFQGHVASELQSQKSGFSYIWVRFQNRNRSSSGLPTTCSPESPLGPEKRNGSVLPYIWHLNSKHWVWESVIGKILKMSLFCSGERTTPLRYAAQRMESYCGWKNTKLAHILYLFISYHTWNYTHHLISSLVYEWSLWIS